MANSSLGYTEPGSPNKRLYSRSFTEDAVTKDAQGIFVCDASGNIVSVTSNALDVNTEMPAAALLADGATIPTAPNVGATMFAANSAGTLDFFHNNSSAVILTSAARTTTQTGSDLVNYNWRGVVLCLNVSSAGTGSITPAIQGKDNTAGAYYQLHANATAVTANGFYVYQIYPGAGTAVGGITLSASNPVPRLYRVVITANNANSMTYSARIEGIV